MKLHTRFHGRAVPHTMRKRCHGLTFRTLILLSVISVVAMAGIAQAALAPIQMVVNAKGEDVGTIDIKVESGVWPAPNSDREGVTGGFTVTKKKPDGTTMTLDELETFLGQDHLNWFQKVTADTHPPKDASGNQLTVPYVDPPSGGYDGGPAEDAIPWYLTEPGELPNGATTSTLPFSDGPQDSHVGWQASFATFLVSDYGDKTYQVLGGATWTAKRGADGKTDITALDKDATFTDEFTAEISEFGWSEVPEPATLVLVTFGMLAGLRRRRAA